MLLAAMVAELHKVLGKVGLDGILAAFVATPFGDVLKAGGFLLLSLAVMSAYDLPGVCFARRAHECPHVPLAKIGLASFCAYALSHILGAPALTAAAIRLRFYAHWDVPSTGLARIVALSGSSFSLGVLSILGLILALDPVVVPLPGDLALALLRALGIVLLLVPVFYVVAASRLESLTLFKRAIKLPGWRIALGQLSISCLDICCACAILYMVLPGGSSGLTYVYILSLYVAAFWIGAASGLPGGVGVFDSVLLLGLTDYISANTALGAILLFRILFFLVPACLAGLCYAAHELHIYTKTK